MATELQKHARTKTVHANETRLTGFILIGAAGAITSQTAIRDGGVTFVKNASTGQYDGTIHRAYRRCMVADCNMIGPTAGTPPNAAKNAFITGIASTAFLGTAGFSTFTIQTTAADGATATNPTSGDMIGWELVLSDSV
jgi:hypothetical protein